MDRISKILSDLSQSNLPDGMSIQEFSHGDGQNDEATKAIQNEHFTNIILEHPCVVCGVNFEREHIHDAITVGPIRSDTSSDNAHQTCFDSVLEANPQIKKILGKKPRDWREGEKGEIRNAFSVLPDEGTYSDLFGKK